MTEMTTSELAARLHVSARHARELVRSQRIAGRQLASGVWLADAGSVARYAVTQPSGSGRTLDSATAWAILWELSGLDASWLTASTRVRVRRRIQTSEATRIAAAVADRARTRRFVAANASLARQNIIATGRMAAQASGIGLIDDDSRLDGYARSGGIDELARAAFLIERADGPHVIRENSLPIPYEAANMPAAVVAADLAVSADTRERSAGLAALEELRQAWLATHTPSIS